MSDDQRAKARERASFDRDIGLSVLIVDDSRLYREGLAAMMEREPDMRLIRCAHDWPSTALAISHDVPDLTLVNADVESSRTIIAQLRVTLPATPVITVNLPEVEEDIIALAEIGVAGYLLRPEPFPDLLRLMRGVVAGETFLSPRVSAALLRRLAAMADERHHRVPILTEREDQILGLLDAGLSNQQIATQLRIELRTVKNHVHNILGKLGVSRRGEAVAAVRSLRTQRELMNFALEPDLNDRGVPVPRSEHLNLSVHGARVAGGVIIVP
jgi:DNA-binding NarL/FixJ family response regulator